MDLNYLAGLIAPVLALLFAMTFIMISVARNNEDYSSMLGSAFVLIAAGLYVPWAFADRFPMGYVVVSDTLFALAVFPVVQSLLKRRGIAPKWLPYLLVCSTWLALSFALAFVEADENVRCVLGSITISALILFLLFPLSKVRNVEFIDRVIYGLLASIAFLMSVRPVFSLMGFDTNTAVEAMSPIAWTLFNIVTIVMLFALAMTLLAACVIDIVREFSAEARTDSLTGLLNRFGFESEAHQAVTYAHLNGKALSFIICDVDNFKSINDDLGHSTGDEALTIIGDALRSVGRSSDPIGRIGGEEFGILAPNAPLEMTRLLAESMRTSIETQSLPRPLQSRGLSASFGVACLHKQENYRSLFARADAALYLAKQSGKNCVRVDDRRPANNNTIREALA